MPFLKFKLLLTLYIGTLLYVNATSLEEVTLQLQWKHQFEFAGFYAAKEKGFYKDAGLDVTLLEYDGEDTIKKVLEGRVDYGLGYSSIISAYANGKPIVFVANFFKQSPLLIVAQENIKSPTQLKHKTIMGVSNTIDNITLINMLNKFDIQMKDIVSLPTSFTLQDFIEKKVDAMSVFSTNELYTLDKLGIKYTLFDPTIYGTEYYDVNLFTSKQKAQKNPEQVRRFKEASIKGWHYALTHKKEIIDLILKKYNTQKKEEEALKYEAQQIENLMLPKVYPIGSIDDNRVKLIAENLKQAGFIANSHFPIESFIFDHTQNAHSFYLTAKEKEFLKNKKVITMCVDPDWMPYEKIKNGKHIGISADTIHEISKKLSIPIKLVSTQTWDESMHKFKEHQCDILSLVAPTPLRRTYMSFTTPFFRSPLVLATLLDKPFTQNIETLKEKKIGLIKNYASTSLLQNRYKDVNFMEVNTLSEGLEQVANGELYGVIDSLTTVSYQIQKRFPTELKIAGQLEDEIALSIGIHKDDIQLLLVFNSIIQSMSHTTKTNILNHWVSVQFDRSNSNMKSFTKIMIPIALIFFLLLLSQFALRQYNKRLKERVRTHMEEIKEKEKMLLQKNRMADMGEMLSMIAHQWKQPLGAINSTISGIRIKIESGKYNLDHPSDQQDFLSYLHRKLDNINQYVEHLSTTTDDFRNFFNPNKTKERMALNIPIENALNLIEDSLQKNGIEVLRDLQANPTFNMYPNEIMQVVLNLLKNSEYNFLDKHSNAPQIIIRSFYRKEKTVLSISDNGGGIPANIAKKIFEPYFSTKNEKNGAGLGLYMSKIIIEDHHYSTLTMRNKDAGVCFEIEFRT